MRDGAARRSRHALLSTALKNAQRDAPRCITRATCLFIMSRADARERTAITARPSLCALRAQHKDEDTTHHPADAA